jgi:hypothetical protein
VGELVTDVEHPGGRVDLLADRGWGKAANFEPREGDPLGLEDVEAAAEVFRAKVMRLAESQNPDSDGA